MKLICPSCGAHYEKGKFCLECGTPLTEVTVRKFLYCPECQVEVPSGKFCPECGCKLEEREEEISTDLILPSSVVSEKVIPAEPTKTDDVDSILSKYKDSYGDFRNLNPEEYAIAAEEIQKCVDLGSVDAMCYLASLYMDGHGVPEDQSLAYKLFTEAESKGSQYAHAFLGIFYLFGIIVEADENEAVRRFSQGYRNTHIPALAGNLAYYYINKKDYANALKFAQEAADKGNEDGLKALGDLYLNGFGVVKDEHAAFENYMQAAALGATTALNQIGWMYMNACGVDEDAEQAFFWFNEAAQKGLDVGMYNVACCYQNGYGVGQDEEVAAEWFKKAAEAGWLDAMFELGKYYLNTLIDFDKAKMWLTKAANQGHADAINCLGVYYADTEGDFKEAVKYYKKAIELGIPNAYRNLALCYHEGKGVKKDEKKAKELLAKASELGVEDAGEIQSSINNEEDNRLIDEANKDFKPGSKNIAKAVRVYKTLAEKGNPRAQHNYAIAYLNGWGVNKNIAEAVKWLSTSADNGFALACLSLAELYTDGTLNKNFELAKSYIDKATEIGLDKSAEKRVKVVQEALSVPMANILNFKCSGYKPDSNKMWMKLYVLLGNFSGVKKRKFNVSFYRIYSFYDAKTINEAVSKPYRKDDYNYYGIDTFDFTADAEGTQQISRLFAIKDLSLDNSPVEGSIYVVVWDVSSKVPVRLDLKSYAYNVTCNKHIFSENEWFFNLK